MGEYMPKKGYGRIYTDKKENVERVKEIIKSIDEDEYEGYFPEDLVAPFSEYPTTVYTHKFNDIDMNVLTALCWKEGIYIWAAVGGNHNYEYMPQDGIKEVSNGD